MKCQQCGDYLTCFIGQYYQCTKGCVSVPDKLTAAINKDIYYACMGVGVDRHDWMGRAYYMPMVPYQSRVAVTLAGDYEVTYDVVRGMYKVTPIPIATLVRVRE